MGCPAVIPATPPWRHNGAASCSWDFARTSPRPSNDVHDTNVVATNALANASGLHSRGALLRDPERVIRVFPEIRAWRRPTSISSPGQEPPSPSVAQRPSEGRLPTTHEWDVPAVVVSTLSPSFAGSASNIHCQETASQRSAGSSPLEPMSASAQAFLFASG